MSLPKPMEAHDVLDDLCKRLARAIQAELPKHFRGRVEVTVDRGLVRAQDVAVQYRPTQPKEQAM